MLSIVTYPAANLRSPSRPIVQFGADLAQLARDMNEIMIHANGIGLAAPQIGENIQLIIVKTGESSDYRAYVNPRITFSSVKHVAIEEGCLSLPGLYGFVDRAAKIRFTYRDLHGKKHGGTARGMEAIVLQHEIDHIEGKLIIDKNIEITKGHIAKN